MHFITKIPYVGLRLISKVCIAIPILISTFTSLKIVNMLCCVDIFRHSCRSFLNRGSVRANLG